MDKVTVGVKSAGPGADHRAQDEVHVSGSAVTIRWPHFMLRVPKPAKPEK